MEEPAADIQRFCRESGWSPRNEGSVRGMLAGDNLRVGNCCGCSSMVEPQLPKLMMWVRFPSPAPCGWGCAHLAQLVEHLHGKQEVTGSIPVVSST